MRQTIDNLLDASVYLWIDNLLVNDYQCFVNTSGSLTKIDYDKNNLKAYKSPYGQWVYDSTVSGAAVPSGVYVNGSFTPRSNSLIIDFNRGCAVSTNQYSNVTASYSHKEINLYLSNEDEQDALFDGRISDNTRTANASSTPLNSWITPCIFIKNNLGHNKPISIDGVMCTHIPFRLSFVSDRDGLFKTVLGAFRDSSQKYIPIADPAQIPFTAFGDLKAETFSYQAIKDNATPDKLAFIRDVRVSPFSSPVNKLIAPRVLGAFIDLDLEILRTT